MSTAPISKQVSAWRTARGLTLDQASRQIGVAIATLFQWEAGTSLPSPMAVPALASAMQRDPADMAGLVARERAARVAGGGQRRVVVGGRSHGAGSRRQPTPAGGRKGGRS
jgi:transcriptional regulator with XRE-family HTH domain